MTIDLQFFIGLAVGAVVVFGIGAIFAAGEQEGKKQACKAPAHD